MRPTDLGHFRALLDWRWRKSGLLYVLDHYRRLAELGLTVKQKRP